MAHRTTYLKKQPWCPKCKGNLYQHDVDYGFKGKQDEFWKCNKCNYLLIVRVRYSKVVQMEGTFNAK